MRLKSPIKKIYASKKKAVAIGLSRPLSRRIYASSGTMKLIPEKENGRRRVSVSLRRIRPKRKKNRNGLPKTAMAKCHSRGIRTTAQGMQIEERLNTWGLGARKNKNCCPRNNKQKHPISDKKGRDRSKEKKSGYQPPSRQRGVSGKGVDMRASKTVT